MGAATDALVQAGIGGATQAMGMGMGMLLEKRNDKRQRRQQKHLTDIQVGAQKELTDYNYNKQLQMWEATGYGGQMEQLKKAGLNPGLIYGMGGGGGATANVNTGSVGGGSANGSNGEAMQGAGMAIQFGLMEAQRKVLESQAKKNEADAAITAGAQTNNLEADTENKVLAGVLLKYGGQEAKDQYERIKAPNRAIEAETYMKEMEARQGLAGTIYELWTEGKLKEKSLHEIEGIALGNALTKEQRRKVSKEIDLLEERIKGEKLENIILDLEAKLQTQTGLDRSSPGWMKILGRLFVGLFGGMDTIKGMQ